VACEAGLTGNSEKIVACEAGLTKCHRHRQRNHPIPQKVQTKSLQLPTGFKKQRMENKKKMELEQMCASAPS